MEILRAIKERALTKGLDFILIGGHAVAVYGVQRQTGDVDLIVARSKRALWDEIFLALRYRSGQNDENFIRYQPASIAAWPVDLMLVDDETLQKLVAAALEVDLGQTRVKVASPRHLITLKIHALKRHQPDRFVKDYNDVIALLRTHGKDVSSADLLELCLRYADRALYDRIQRDLPALP